MRKIITENSVIKEGFKKMNQQVFLKKTRLNTKCWIRCSHCNRFLKKPILLRKGQKDLIIMCDWCRNSDGEPNLKMKIDIFPMLIKIRKPDL